MIQLSVVIPTIGRSLLSDTVRSVTDSAEDAGVADRVELVVADQSGNVEQGDLVSSLPLSVHYSATKGASINRNHGVAHSRGRFVAFVDDDCVADSSWVDAVLSAAADHPDRIATGQVVSTGDDDKTPSTISLSEEEMLVRPVPDCWRLYTGNMVVARSPLVAVGGFDERFRGTAQDADFAFRWLSTGREMVYLPSLLVFHQDWRSHSEAGEVERRYERGAGFLFGVHVVDSGHFRRSALKTVGRAARAKSFSPTARGLVDGVFQSARSGFASWDGSRSEWLSCRRPCDR